MITTRGWGWGPITTLGYGLGRTYGTVKKELLVKQRRRRLEVEREQERERHKQGVVTYTATTGVSMFGVESVGLQSAIQKSGLTVALFNSKLKKTLSEEYHTTVLISKTDFKETEAKGGLDKSSKLEFLGGVSISKQGKTILESKASIDKKKMFQLLDILLDDEDT